MTRLSNKIDFVALITVNNANPNGDPLNGNRPRTDYEGYGEISDVCIKRKIRNRLQNMGQKVFVQSEDRSDDSHKSLRERAEAVLPKTKNQDDYSAAACAEWIDVRSFGQVFAFKGAKDTPASCGIRGPVSIQYVKSASPVDVESMQITKSVNGEPSEKRGHDTMGPKHSVRFGLYILKGAINVQHADKTGFSAEDASLIKESLRTLFVNDSSSARPEGSMELHKLYWWEHNCEIGQYSSAKVHRSVRVSLKDGIVDPSCIDDYEVEIMDLPGLSPEVIEGI